jgi:hypothetical protein
MKLRQIASHHYTVLAVLDPVAGDAVLAVLRDAKRFYSRLFEQIMAALKEYTPIYGPPFAEKRHGIARAKRLDEGLSELIARNQESSRRRRGKQTDDEKNVGIRVFFFEYGRDVICTNACYKTSPTPPDAIPAALRIRSEFFAAMASGDLETLEGD